MPSSVILALALGSASIAHARAVTHYVAACRSGNVLYLGDSASLTKDEAKESGRLACVDSGGYRGLYSREAPRNDGPAVLADVKSAYAKQLWDDYKSDHDAQLRSAARAETDRVNPPISPVPAVVWPARSYDCLAGVCLGGKAPADDGPVTVAQLTMRRYSEVCSGVVASIEVTANFSYVPQNEHDRILSDLLGMGWSIGQAGGLPGLGLTHTHKHGLRWLHIMQKDYSRWTLVIATLHPARDALCEAKRREGL